MAFGTCFKIFSYDFGFCCAYGTFSTFQIIRSFPVKAHQVAQEAVADGVLPQWMQEDSPDSQTNRPCFTLLLLQMMSLVASSCDLRVGRVRAPGADSRGSSPTSCSLAFACTVSHLSCTCRVDIGELWRSNTCFAARIASCTRGSDKNIIRRVSGKPSQKNSYYHQWYPRACYDSFFDAIYVNV